jgi:glutamate synthase (NADPH/NADH) small chain
MGASRYEQDLAMTSGVAIHHWAAPVKIIGDDHVERVEFERTVLNDDGALTMTGERFSFDADVVFKAIGQALGDLPPADAVAIEHGRIVVDDDMRTSLDDVWAGGDCVLGGDDLTVTAVQHGKLAAHSIDRRLRG